MFLGARLFLVLLSLFTITDLFALAERFFRVVDISHKAGYSENYSYITGDFIISSNIDQENRKMLEGCISQIEKYCPQLLNKILDELKDQRINFVFSDEYNDGTAFVPPRAGEKVKVIVNLAKTQIVEEQLLSTVPTLNEAKKITDENVVMVYGTPSPFWLTIAHELIHLKHWLDEKNGRTVDTFDSAFDRDMCTLSYSAAKANSPDLIINRFNRNTNIYRLLALIDDLWNSFNKTEEIQAKKDLIKLFAPFSENIDKISAEIVRELTEKLMTEYEKSDKTIVFLSILDRLKKRFPSLDLETVFSSLESSLREGKSTDQTALIIVEIKRMLWEIFMTSKSTKLFEGDSFSLKMVKLFPELFGSIKVGMISMWPDLEERRTVLGPDIDNISEASIRIAANLPVRYIYQDKTEYIIEDLNILKDFMRVPGVGIHPNMFPDSMSLIPLKFLFKIHRFKLKDIFNKAGNLTHIASIFGYRVPANFMKTFE